MKTKRNPEIRNPKNTWVNLPEPNLNSCDQLNNMTRVNSIDSEQSEIEYNMVTGDNPTCRTVPEIFTERPMQPRENPPGQVLAHNESLDTTPSVPETSTPNTLADLIERLADVLVGKNDKPSAKTLKVRPVSTKQMTFDGKPG